MIRTDSPVLVTGATGYVAGWIVKRLLEAGVTIHAAVRDPKHPTKLEHLKAMAKESSGEIQFFAADLLEPGSYAKAMQGCSIVFHTASPFTTSVDDPQSQLVEPAQLGTRNVLETACETDTVRRVVLTSSCAAIYGDNLDVQKAPGGILTEEIWNTSSSVDHQPYSYSKTVAEREAWKIAESQTTWKLVVINPSLVIGPGTNPHATSESFELVKQLGDGTMKIGAPRWGMGVVDVRDVAAAHIAAAFKPDAEGRHIVSGTDTNFLEMGRALLDRFGDRYPLPRRALPKLMLWLVGPMINPTMTRKTVSRNVNLPFRADNQKSIRDLGISYRPMQESLEEMFQQLVDSGQLSSK